MKPLPVLLALVLFLIHTQATLAQTGVTPDTPWSDLTVRAHVEPALLKRLVTAGPDERVPMIVEMRQHAAPLADHAAQIASLQATAAATQREVRAFLAGEVSAGRAQDVRPFWIFNGLAVHATRQTAEQLAVRSDVELLRLDRYEYRLEPGMLSGTAANDGPTWGVQRVRADQVWAAFNDTGSGVVVANMDTGVDFLHPALNANYRGNAGKDIYQHTGNWYDATDDGTTYPYDGNGHGTHTMGTLAGAGGIGVAPGAHWIAVRVLNNQGYGYSSWIHAGFEWLLAPGGDPKLAPRIVSNSWGNAIADDTEFQADLQQLQQANILFVFAAGNTGPQKESLSSPGSLPGVLAVGAIDSDNEVASFSSRGPSPWDEIKPQLAAPGVSVLSSIPGGSYANANGTSMATPHVAGILALMLAINPHLTMPAATFVLTSTAVPLGASVPNNASGWGRVDAYAAVQAAAGAGAVSGTVIDSASRLPLSGAQVTARREGVGSGYVVMTGADGRYTAGLTAGPYEMTAQLFGYQASEPKSAIVITGTTTNADLALTPLPVGVLRGVLTDVERSTPATITVSAAGTPIAQTAYGLYQFALPAGTYMIQARGVGYRVVTTTVSITAGQVTQRDFAVVPTDRILLVDSGAWYQNDFGGYFRQALDRLGFAYDEYRIKHMPADTPTFADLAKYDLVLWSSPQDSPGFVGASTAITRYLSSGHKLLVTGQDVAYWDGGGSGFFWAPYLRSYLMTDFVRDDSLKRSVAGTPDDFLAPLTFQIEKGDGANDQYAPDEIAVANSDYARGVLNYTGDGLAGNKIGLCLKYRALLLSFGYESIASAAQRQDLMQRALDYFVAPGLQSGLNLAPISAPLMVGQAGSTVTFTVRARNIGEAGTTLSLSAHLQSAGWPVTMTPAQLSLAPCATATLTVTAQIPAGSGVNVRNPISLTLSATGTPGLSASLGLTAKTPAAVLLIDHRRWYNTQDTYTRVLDQAGLGYDVWTLPNSGPPSAFDGPTVDRLRQYPIVAWLTGFDWYQPISPNDEKQLSSYLDQGGRLLLSSAFYLELHGQSQFARERLGVLDYTSGLTATASYGAPGEAVGAGFGRIPLTNPFPRTSFFTLDGAIVPSAARVTTWRGDHYRPQALADSQAGNRLAFWDLPIEALPPDKEAQVLQRTIGWLGPLGDSSADVSPGVVRNGGVATITLAVRDNLWATTAWLTATLPEDLAPILPVLPPGLSYDAVQRTLTWYGPLAPGAAQVFAVPVRATAAGPGWAAGRVVFGDSRSGLLYDQPLSVGIDEPDLSTSSLSTTAAQPGQPATAQMTIRNTGPAAASPASVIGLLPPGGRIMTGTATLVGPGAITEGKDRVTWEGSLEPGAAATVRFQVQAPSADMPPDLAVDMLAWAGQNGAWEWRGWLRGRPPSLFYPLIERK